MWAQCFNRGPFWKKRPWDYVSFSVDQLIDFYWYWIANVILFKMAKINHVSCIIQDAYIKEKDSLYEPTYVILFQLKMFSVPLNLTSKSSSQKYCPKWPLRLESTYSLTRLCHARVIELSEYHIFLDILQSIFDFSILMLSCEKCQDFAFFQ